MTLTKNFIITENIKTLIIAQVTLKNLSLFFLNDNHCGTWRAKVAFSR